MTARKIVTGELDAAIDAAAEAFKAYPREFFMRYCWEMDGQRPEKRNLVGKPEEFIAAWRYVYKRIVETHGVSNVVWVFCVNANGFKVRYDFTGGRSRRRSYYPGDEYVDWVSADGYNWHGVDQPERQGRLPRLPRDLRRVHAVGPHGRSDPRQGRFVEADPDR